MSRHRTVRYPPFSFSTFANLNVPRRAMKVPCRLSIPMLRSVRLFLLLLLLIIGFCSSYSLSTFQINRFHSQHSQKYQFQHRSLPIRLLSTENNNNNQFEQNNNDNDNDNNIDAIWDQASTMAVSPLQKTKQTPVPTEPSFETRRNTNTAVAVAAAVLGISNYLYHYFHPVTPLALLVSLQSQSAPITLIGTNNKPTVVDFWAPWCTNCQSMAGTLAAIENDYAGKVNFIMVDGDKKENWPLIERFGVDAIPHMALLDSEGNVETALIGPIPKSVMKADLDVLLTRNHNHDEPLPFVMLDVFQNQPDLRKVSFTE
jgi:thiol-disulfide isomerase/thioredoxin